MASVGRYEIVDTIASGDFATVYRGRDRELGREVAIKQIHQQFLNDPRQLERYWREAQLLASLQHPNILTIYDIVRARGWLILELMRGNLQRRIQAGPIDLDHLRLVLVESLQALHFLHVNGIIHGDVKPSNLLVDAQNRVKLGDFGLARRASSEQGSLLKGTTKYMAPELVSNQFGPIGPASDLYSLGFTAYELMCGPQFETLFPGLGTFGRDRQIAWLMWQAAPDRNLPEIRRVLEGVPDDLARVVSRLVVKDQARRYHSAQEVLCDLRTDGAATRLAADQAEVGPPPMDKRKKMLRIGAVLAFVCSLLLCVWVLLPSRRPPPPAPPPPVQGMVADVDLNARKLVIERAEDHSRAEIDVSARDEIFINDKKELLRDLRRGDRLSIERYRDPMGFRIARITVTRPQSQQGRIAEIDAAQGKLTLVYGEDEKKLVISVPAGAPILLNGRKDFEGKPIALADLRAEDRVTVEHFGEATGRTAAGLSVERVVSFNGVIRAVDLKKSELTATRGEGPTARAVTWPLAPKCEVTINDRRFLNERMLTPSDLRPGDRATVAHDSQVMRVNAYRVLGQEGVVRSVGVDTKTLEVAMHGQERPITYLTGARSKITISGEQALLADLRAGDLVDITHDSPGSTTPEALTIAARRPPDPTRWAILVAGQNFDDRSLTPIEYPLANAKLLQEALLKRYAVPEQQAQMFADASHVRLEQGIPEILQRIKEEDRLIVYVVGHAYKDADGSVYFAPKNFNLKQPAASGLGLQWLVDQLEKCPAKDKLLLVDCSHAGSGADLAAEPSSAEMIQAIKAPPGMAALRTLTAVASCSSGERGYAWPDKEHGLFAVFLVQGYNGEADKNRDKRIEPTELFSYLAQAMKSVAAQVGHVQTPALFLPNPRPPRLTDEARKAIRGLASMLRESRVDLKAAMQAYAQASKLAGSELEPKLLYGLLLARSKQRDDAISQFEKIKTEQPSLLVTMQALAWLRFTGRAHQAGVAELTDLVSHTAKPGKAGEPLSEEHRQLFEWTGQLRAFAAEVQDARPVSEESLKKLDAAVAACGEEAVKAYQQGQEKTKSTAQDFDQRIGQATDEATKLKLGVDRRQLPNYVSFPFDDAVKQILAGMEK